MAAGCMPLSLLWGMVAFWESGNARETAVAAREAFVRAWESGNARETAVAAFEAFVRAACNNLPEYARQISR